MDDPVETVAKAIHENVQSGMDEPMDWEDAHENYKFARRQDARAAIEACDATIEGRRDKLIDWLNAFKADPFSTGAEKADRLIATVSILR